MKDYLLKLKKICDNSTTCGRFVPEENQTLSILADLGSEFEPSVVVLTSRIDSYNIQTANVLLLVSGTEHFNNLL